MTKRVCVFVDGENFRHTICDLFEHFDQADYLPKQATWQGFFDWLVHKSSTGGERVRTYWYVIENMDFFPYRFPDPYKGPEHLILLKKLLSKKKDFKIELASLEGNELQEKMRKIVGILLKKRRDMENRAGGWIRIQDAISTNNNAIEFRREGSIRYDLFKNELGSEKGVDISLAVDMITLSDIYDVAIIVSGDQDYIPAVRKIKDFGKRVVNVSFENRAGKLLPGGAWRLNAVTDDVLRLKYHEFSQHMGR